MTNDTESQQVIAERATIREVAQLAGVSISTVSRVVNQSGYFSAETAAKVNQAIEKLNYRPHISAQGLASQRTNILGLVIRELSTPFIIPVLRGIEQVTRAYGYNLLINSHSQMDEAPQLLGENNTDGLLILANPGISNSDLMRFHRINFPVVLMFRIPPPEVPLPYVAAENVDSSRKLIEHLIVEHGLKRIAFLRGPDSEQDSARRERGYREALQKHGLQVDPALIGYGGFKEDISEKTVAQWLEEGIEIDAIFTDDESAVGVYRAIESANLGIPDDIAVVGFDDDFMAPRLFPPLTTVHVPSEELGRQAAQSLIQYIQTGQADSIVMPTQIVIRASCGCASRINDI